MYIEEPSPHSATAHPFKYTLRNEEVKSLVKEKREVCGRYLKGSANEWEEY